MADELPPLPPGAVLINDTQPGGLPPLPPGAVLIDDTKSVDKQRGVDLDLLSEAGTNFIPSLTKNVGQMVEGIGSAVASPIETAKTLGKLAITAPPMTEAVTGMLVRAIAPHLDDEKKKKLAGWLGDLYGPKHALMKDYADTYGGKDELLKTIATDPVRVFSDIATIATGAAGATARAAGPVGRTVNAVSRAVENLDPLTATGRVAAGGIRRIPGFFDSTTNVGEGPMREAVRAGVEGGQTAVDFRAAMRQGVPVEEVVDLAREKIRNMKTDMFAEYNRERVNWAGSNQPNLGFDEINNAERRVANMISSNPGSTLRFKVNSADQARINTLQEVVEEWRRDPTSWTIEGLDDLKQRLRNEINWTADRPVFNRAAQTLIEGVRAQINQNAPPSYRQAMRAYTEASREFDNIEQAFSLGRNAQMQTAMSKLQSVMRNNANTQYGLRDRLLGRLDEQGGRQLRPILAGAALSADAPRGIARGAMSGSVPALGSMLFGASALDPVTMGLGAAGYGLGRVATSPRTMGGVMYSAGAAARPFNRAWQRLNPTTQSILRAATTQPARNAYGAFDRTQEDPFGGYAAGGYFSGRA